MQTSVHAFIHVLTHSFIHCSKDVVIHFHHLYVVKSAKGKPRKNGDLGQKLDALFPDLHLPTPAPRFSYLGESVWDFLEVFFLFGHGNRLKFG